MLPDRTYNPEYLKIKNGFVRAGIYENRSCFDKCKKKVIARLDSGECVTEKLIVLL